MHHKKKKVKATFSICVPSFKDNTFAHGSAVVIYDSLIKGIVPFKYVHLKNSETMNIACSAIFIFMWVVLMEVLEWPDVVRKTDSGIKKNLKKI